MPRKNSATDEAERSRTASLLSESSTGPADGRGKITTGQGAVLPPPGEPFYVEEGRPAPKSVAIVAMGPSNQSFLKKVSLMGGPGPAYDEIWAINAMGGVLKHDRLFQMDDLRVQCLRAEADPEGMVAGMLPWMREHPGPIYTSVAHPDFPGSVEFPLSEAITYAGMPYFNSTVAYPVCYAGMIGVERLGLYGVDFNYSDQNAAESGRACVEWHLRALMERGVKIELPSDTTLFDSAHGLSHRLYGYDGCKVTLHFEEGRGLVAGVEVLPDSELPDVADVERRYNHRLPLQERIELQSAAAE